MAPTPSIGHAPQPLRDRRILVVGASSGIGAATARAAAAFGARLALAARSRAQLEDIAAELDATPIIGDVTEAADCVRIVEEAAAHLGQIDGVLYTPAPGFRMLLEHTSDGDWEAQFRSIVVGANDVTRAAVAHLGPDAVVLYLSSAITRRVQYGMASYAACKSALEAMAAGWRREHPEIRFTTVNVGQTAGTRPRPQHGADPELGREVVRRMVNSGFVHRRSMNAGDLGQFVVELITALLDHPTIAVPDIVVEPASPPVFADDDDAAALLDRVGRGAGLAPEPPPPV